MRLISVNSGGNQYRGSCGTPKCVSYGCVRVHASRKVVKAHNKEISSTQTHKNNTVTPTHTHMHKPDRALLIMIIRYYFRLLHY